MRKTLLALPLLCSFSASSSNAADVLLYGLLNPSLTFVSSNGDFEGSQTQTSFSMDEGKEFGSRWGIRGMESIRPDLRIGFVLESGFRGDTGAPWKGEHIFDRETHIDLHTGFGKFSIGLIPIFGSVLGTDGLFRAIQPLFANHTVGFGSGLITASDWTRADNSVSYVSPTFAGLTGYAMYSLKKDGSGNKNGQEGMAESDRYASLALRYQNGALETILVADTTLYGSVDSAATNACNLDQGYTVTLGGNYSFGNGLMILAFGQYFEDQMLNTATRAGVSKAGVEYVAGSYGHVSGFGLSLGANYPVGEGTIKGQIAYRDMNNTEHVDFNRWFAALGYDHPLSTRTSFFAMTGFSQEKIENNHAKTEAAPYGFELTAGILHRF